ncbi:histidine kinase [Pedobacter sp. KR3-3]|uniref:Histidine kinase n=1 Tax=Pedobacter albus TaxID=3113905 RepID=A0ABU7ICL1_9SPHI|nr:histidine kinase [Pedobacter sp. KR3-3]MEE1947230.1 histidine kinase [Pedobacter sp. KR3-3]
MQKKYKIGLHVLVWMVFFLNDLLPKYFSRAYRSYSGDVNSFALFVKYLGVNLGYLFSGIVVFYGVAYWIAPLAFRHKKWIQSILATLGLCIFIVGYRYVIEFLVLKPYLGFDNYFGSIPETSWYIKNALLYSLYSYFSYGFIFFFINEWYISNRKKKELEQEKITTELAFLKSQINPHFLFNTLNDIYALTYRRSDDAPAAVLKLSALLRYMLKESDEQLVPLDREIGYLHNVIELHKIGQKGNAYIDFKVEGHTEGLKIAPLILINFVENAFKHGVFDDHEHPIQIQMAIADQQMVFKVFNLKNHDQKDKTGGIGLSNVQRRLSLIYPQRHTLAIGDENTTFTITLQINLQ